MNERVLTPVERRDQEQLHAAIAADFTALNEHPDRFFVESDGDLGRPRSVYIFDKRGDRVCTMEDPSNKKNTWKWARIMCAGLNKRDAKTRRNTELLSAAMEVVRTADIDQATPRERFIAVNELEDVIDELNREAPPERDKDAEIERLRDVVASLHEYLWRRPPGGSAHICLDDDCTYCAALAKAETILAQTGETAPEEETPCTT